MNGRFEAMTPEELAGNFSQLENPTPPERALLSDEDVINNLLEMSNRKVSWVLNTINAADAKVAAIDRNLRADIIAQKADAIRKAANDEIEQAVTEIRKYAELAKAQEKFYTPEACRLRASFSSDPAMDATIRLSWSDRLGKMHVGSITTAAELCSATDNLALADAIAQELEARDDLPELDGKKLKRGSRDEIYRLLASVSNPSRRVLGTISSIKLNCEQVKAATSKTYSAINRISLGLQELSQ